MLFRSYDFDRSRLVISAEHTAITGEALMEHLRNTYHLELEMAERLYATGISSVADQEQDFARLGRALYELDRLLTENPEWRNTESFRGWPPLKAQPLLPLGTALEQEKEWVELSRCPNRIAGAFLYLYPPGIPLVVPGEEITKEL